ncbi:uncharacterized protein LOC110734808 isoform X2 [Chenopodium quinoa]|uniref:uncharacterized protein LOC110734808 isoform X2 n=1 Tax=Chenopodium quinoa TaxID=63459 RepID=UPI000B780052|nr:uncharacterized protein LOC110734808 isoform X2 [Chenopodium quinoa]
MARRGRPRKVGLKRIDAAIDALKPMGFSPEIVRMNVDKLLKEYGEEGWPFIEEASYKLLIEYILEPPESPNEDRCQEGGEDEPEEAGPSGEPSESLCSNHSTLVATDTPLASSEPVAVHKPSLSLAESAKSPSQIEVNQANAILIDQENSLPFPSIYTLPIPPGIEHVRQEKIAPSTRRPCYGWIGPNTDEDIILLTPAPVLSWRTGKRPRKRKSRWDVGPLDVV